MSGRTAVFLLTALTLLLIALSTGAAIYYLVSAAMLAMALLSLASALALLFRLEVKAETRRRRARRGDSVAVNLFVRRRSLLPAGLVKLDISSTEEDGESSRIVMGSVPLRGRQYHYSVRCAHRGLYEAGVTRLTVSDVFGLFTLSRKMSGGVMRIEVLPRTSRIEPMAILPGDLGPEGHVRMTEDRASPSGVRTWQEGDGLKNVHWKLTARRRELMVRTFEESARPDVLILMDCAPVDALRTHVKGIEDALCEAAANAALAQMTAGYAVRMPLNAAEPTETVGQTPADIARFLETLALLKFDSPYPFEQVLALEMRRLQRTGAAVFVSARLNGALAELALRMQQQGVQTQFVWVSETVHSDYETLLRRMEFMGVKVRRIDPYEAAANAAAEEARAS